MWYVITLLAGILIGIILSVAYRETKRAPDIEMRDTWSQPLSQEQLAEILKRSTKL